MESSIESTTKPEGSPPPTTPSKSSLKKAARLERYAATKLERRAKEREAKKEKKKQKAEKRAAGELDEDEEEESKRKKKKARVGPRFGGKVVVDLGFDDMMHDKEIVSLCSQLAYTYSANRQESFPFSIVFSSLNGRTFTRLERMSDAAYKRWTHTEWWSEGYERLWSSQSQSQKEDIPSGSREDQNGNGTAPEEGVDGGAPDIDDIRQTVVYLTADAEDELTELKASETYIIGGICDHNRYKNLCLNKAKASGIRTARLPIGRYLANLPTRKVLTVNQVFEILLRWVETKSWEEALYAVIPKRKFQQGGKDKTGSETGAEVGRTDNGNVDIPVPADVIVVGEEAEAFNEEFTSIPDKKDGTPEPSPQDIGTLASDAKVDIPHEQ